MTLNNLHLEGQWGSVYFQRDPLWFSRSSPRWYLLQTRPAPEPGPTLPTQSTSHMTSHMTLRVAITCVVDLTPTPQLHDLTHWQASEVVSSWRRCVNCHSLLHKVPLKLSWVCLTVRTRIYKHQLNISCFLCMPGWCKPLVKIRQKIKEPPPPLFFFPLDT